MKTVKGWSDKVAAVNSKSIPPLYGIIYTLDGTKIITAASTDIIIYHALEGGVLKVLKAHNETVLCLSPLIGGGFASGGADKQVVIWSSVFQGILKFSLSDTVQSISQNSVTGVVLSCSHLEFALWTPDVKALPRTKVQSRIVSSSWSIDGQLFALGHFNGIVSIRSSTGDELVKIDRGGNPIWSLAWSPATELDTNILAVADWSQKLAFFDASGKQIGKNRELGYDPCCISYFGNGEYLLIGGSNKQVDLWTADGIKIGKVSEFDGWVWSCSVMPNDSYVAVGTADGVVSVHQILFDTIHAIFQDRYAYRQNLTNVIIQHLATNQTALIKCRDCVRKIAVYKESLAVQLTGKIYVYELNYDQQGEMHYKIKENVERTEDCTLMLVTTSHLLFSSDKKIEMISFSGSIIHSWQFDAIVRQIKIIGGQRDKEGILVALKDGHVLKVFTDNAFPISLIQHKSAIKCADISLYRNKLAVVDDENTCSVYDISKNQLMYQEPDISNAIWNTEVEDAICFSGNNCISVKVDQFVAYQQKLRGSVVGYKGSRLFYLCKSTVGSVDIPQTVPMEGFIERGDFDNAYRVASLGSPDYEWKRLSLAAMEQLSLDVAKKGFSRIRNFRFLEAIRVIEKMKQDGRRETDLFQAEVSAYCENFQEAARLYKKSGNVQKAIEMFTELNMWDQATQLAEEIHGDTHDILTRKAEIQQDCKKVLDAAATYEQIGDYKKAIDLLGAGYHWEKLYALSQKVPETDKENLQHCLGYFSNCPDKGYSLDLLKKMKDIGALIKYYVDEHDWEKAFQIGENNPEYQEQIYLPYGNFLALNDKFEEAQVYYTMAGRPNEAIRILKILAESAVIQNRYRLAAHYYWSLSNSCINSSQKVSAITQREDKIKINDIWKSYLDLAELYYAYSHIAHYVEDPFTRTLPRTLLNTAKFVLQNLNSKPTPSGISKTYAFYAMAKISFQLGCFKLSKMAYEKLLGMCIPVEWQDTIDLAAMTARSKSSNDGSEFSIDCPQCLSKNPPFSPKLSACLNCFEPFNLSFYSFDVLPIIRFAPPPSLTELESERLIKTDPPSSTADVLSKQLEKMDQSGNNSYSPIQFSANDLLSLDPQKVFIKKWGSYVPTEYFLVTSNDIFVVMCSSCQHFFVEEEWNYYILVEGMCPFCRSKSCNVS